jgi:Uma2 family endonuclease
MGSAARVTSAAEGLPRRRFTVAEVEAMVAAGVMDEDERVELIGGELVPMSPKGYHHEVLKIALLRRWYRLAPDDCELASETTFRLSEDAYLEPDVVIFPGMIELKDIKGPNVFLVVEIADTSRPYDMGRKATLYASFGVRQVHAGRGWHALSRRRQHVHRRGQDRPRGARTRQRLRAAGSPSQRAPAGRS